MFFLFLDLLTRFAPVGYYYLRNRANVNLINPQEPSWDYPIFFISNKDIAWRLSDTF